MVYEYDTSRRMEFCFFLDSRRCIITDHGIFPIPPQHRPACALDDTVSPSPKTLLRLREDGWIWVVGRKGERRVCWLPPAYRPLQPELGLNIVFLRDSIRMWTQSCLLVVLDLKKWFEYSNTDS